MSTESTGAGSGRVRASDAEREEYARIVRDAVGEGRLDIEEGDERLARIYAARYRDELRPMLTDLPRDDAPHGYGRSGPGAPHGPRPGGPYQGGPWPGGGPGRGGPWPGGPWRRGRYGFARHFGFVAVVAAVLIGIWALTASTFFWPAIPLAFLAFGLFRHGCGLGWRRARWGGGEDGPTRA